MACPLNRRGMPDHGDWQAETHHVVDPDGSQHDLILVVCGKCGHVTGLKRPTPPKSAIDPTWRTVMAESYDDDDPESTPPAPWRAVEGAVPGPEDTARILTSPPKVGDSDPPPEPLRRAKPASNAGLYLRTRGRK
jgi:hypothetical protein